MRALSLAGGCSDHDCRTFETRLSEHFQQLIGEPEIEFELWFVVSAFRAEIFISVSNVDHDPEIRAVTAP
jgi:hypothetical protein